MQKRSKFNDISSIRRRVQPKKVIRRIKREVVSSEVWFAVLKERKQQALAKLAFEIPQAKLPVLKKNRRPVLLQMGSFVLAGIILIGILQGALYLSSARTASGEILGAATSAYTDFHAAGQNLGTQNFTAAEQLFTAAQNNIQTAQGRLNDFKALQWLTPQAAAAQHVLTGAGLLAEAGQKLTAALNLFDELKVSNKGVETAGFNEKIMSNRAVLAQASELVTQASEEFNSVGSVPNDYDNTLSSAKQQVAELNSILQKLVGLEDLYLGLFQGQKTYLLIFQNTDEERATGGFIGTYGVLAASNGSITKLKIESIYQLDGQIFEQIAAPGPMQPDIKRWGIRDANWFADFPTSAQKLLYFFEKGGETADGVISATPALFQQLLKLTGPIEMQQYGVTLTPDNFQQMVQFKTSVDYDHKLNQPKKFLADFAPILLNRLQNLTKDQWFGLFQIFEDNLKQRSILLYNRNETVENRIKDLRFAGQVLSADYDYLSIINSNLGGTKTDLSVDQTVKLQSRILSDGAVINTLTIKRKNSAETNNKDYLRVLVPVNSQFVSAAGFDDHPYFASVARDMGTDSDLAAWDQGELHSNVYVRTESGKTEFGGWLDTAAGQEKSVTLTYILPFKIKADGFSSAQAHSLLLQKQAGAKPFAFEGSLSLGQFRSNWLGPDMKQNSDIVNFNSESNTDDFWPLVISR